LDIADLFMQMYEGNWVAWLAFSLGILAVALIALFGIVWWKMPQPAKKLFLNNLVGHRPVVADAYDNKVVVFETPRIFREGVLHDKHSGWHFVPRLTKDAEGPPNASGEDVDKFLNPAEQEVISKTFTIHGAPGQFYLAYSGKGTIVNPELQMIIEQSRKMQKGNPDGYAYVDKNVLISALQTMKESMVKIEPVWLTWFLDPRKIKQYLSKAYSKSQLLAQEIEIQESMREEFKGGLIKIVAFLSVIILLGVIAIAIKEFKLI